jgi:hypothetical protein
MLTNDRKVLILAAAVGLIAAAYPKQSSGVIKAQRIEITDAEGHVRAVLGVDEAGRLATLKILDPVDNEAAVLLGLVPAVPGGGASSGSFASVLDLSCGDSDRDGFATAKLVAAPTGAMTVTSWEKQDRAYSTICTASQAENSCAVEESKTASTDDRPVAQCKMSANAEVSTIQLHDATGARAIGPK